MANFTEEELQVAGFKKDALLVREEGLTERVRKPFFQKATRDKTINLVHTNMNGWECEILWYKGVFGTYEGKFSFDVGRKSLAEIESIKCPFTQEDE